MRRLLLAAGAVSTASLGLADTSGQQGRENLKLEQITIVGERVEEIAGSAYVGFQKISGCNYPLTGPKSLKSLELMSSFLNGRFKPGETLHPTAPAY